MRSEIREGEEEKQNNPSKCRTSWSLFFDSFRAVVRRRRNPLPLRHHRRIQVKRLRPRFSSGELQRDLSPLVNDKNERLLQP